MHRNISTPFYPTDGRDTVLVQSRGCSTARRLEFRQDEQAIKRSSLDELFKGRHFLAEVILVSVRWYLEYKLSWRDISRLMAERGISVDHSTILRWVRRHAPEFEKKWHRYARLIGPSWRVDETNEKVGGTWTYLYRGVDKSGKSTVSHLSRNRTVGAAKTYLRKATRAHMRRPHTVTLDGYAASHRAVREFSEHPPGDRSRAARPSI
jgi:transposase-like protein